MLVTGVGISYHPFGVQAVAEDTIASHRTRARAFRIGPGRCGNVQAMFRVWGPPRRLNWPGRIQGTIPRSQPDLQAGKGWPTGARLHAKRAQGMGRPEFHRHATQNITTCGLLLLVTGRPKAGKNAGSASSKKTSHEANRWPFPGSYRTHFTGRPWRSLSTGNFHTLCGVLRAQSARSSIELFSARWTRAAKNSLGERGTRGLSCEG